MKKSFEKFAGTLRQMPKRRMASAAIFALYTIFLCSCSTKEQDGNEPEIRDLEQNQVQIIYTHPCFSGKKLSAVVTDEELTESDLRFIKRQLILDLFPRDDIRIVKMIFPGGEQIGIEKPCTVPKGGKQSEDGDEPEIRDLEQNQVQIIYTHPCFSGKKLSAVISDMKLTESNLIFIKRLLILNLFPRDDIRIVKMIFPLGEQIGTDGPCTVPEDGKQSDIVGKPLEQGFRELEKSIYKTFLLSVVLIFIMRLFSK